MFKTFINIFILSPQSPLLSTLNKVGCWGSNLILNLLWPENYIKLVQIFQYSMFLYFYFLYFYMLSLFYICIFQNSFFLYFSTSLFLLHFCISLFNIQHLVISIFLCPLFPSSPPFSRASSAWGDATRACA